MPTNSGSLKALSVPRGNFNTASTKEHTEMINSLKKSHLNFGYERPTSQIDKPFNSLQPSGQKASQEIGERAQVAAFTRARGFKSNVLPLNSNSANTKPGIGVSGQNKQSATKATF